MIDLHMHTTASDGRCDPWELAQRVHAAGLRTFAVTDHDTVAGLDEASRAAEELGLTLVPGIEVTAVWGARDVHVLGYWIDAASPSLQTFLAIQRARRIDRARTIGEALARAGAPVDLTPLYERAHRRPGSSVGRPGIARLLVAAGHAASVQDAFERLLGEGCPAFVPRVGVEPAEACRVIHDSGGLASMAHPGVTRQDPMVAEWARTGLDALEVFHSDHDDAERERYLRLAGTLGLAVTGGSDFHGDDPMSHRSRKRALGGTVLPADLFDAFDTRRAAPRPS